MQELKSDLRRYFDFYNSEWFYASLEYATPNFIYEERFTYMGRSFNAVA